MTLMRLEVLPRPAPDLLIRADLCAPDQGAKLRYPTHSTQWACLHARPSGAASGRPSSRRSPRQPMLVVGFSIPSAFAADGPFTIDWHLFPDAGPTTSSRTSAGTYKELGPLNSSTTKIGVIHNDAVPTLG